MSFIFYLVNFLQNFIPTGLSFTAYILLLVILIFTIIYLLSDNTNKNNNNSSTSNLKNRDNSNKNLQANSNEWSSSESQLEQDSKNDIHAYKSTPKTTVGRSQSDEDSLFDLSRTNSSQKDLIRQNYNKNAKTSDSDSEMESMRRGRSYSTFNGLRQQATKLVHSATLINFDIPTHSRSGRRLRKRERFLIMAKRAMRLNNPNIEALQPKAPPDSVLKPDPNYTYTHFGHHPDLPDELTALYKTVRIFGHFDRPVFLNLCRHMETIELREGEYLFRRGDCDQNIYVVQSGQVDVYIRERLVNYAGSDTNLEDYEHHIEDSNIYGNEWRVAEVKNGESIHSLLSVLDVITGHMAPYKTVTARAVQHSKVLKLPVAAMNDEFMSSPDALIRLVQVIAMRLQRVTMFTLHNYLGLTTQLIKARVDFDISDYKISKVDEVLETKRRESLLRKSESFLNSQQYAMKASSSVLSVKSNSTIKEEPAILPTLGSMPHTTESEKSLQISHSDLSKLEDQNLNLYNPSSNIDIVSKSEKGKGTKMTRFAELETVVTEPNSKSSAQVYMRNSNLGQFGDEFSSVVRQAFVRENNYSVGLGFWEFMLKIIKI